MHSVGELRFVLRARNRRNTFGNMYVIDTFLSHKIYIGHALHES